MSAAPEPCRRPGPLQVGALTSAVATAVVLVVTGTYQHVGADWAVVLGLATGVGGSLLAGSLVWWKSRPNGHGHPKPEREEASVPTTVKDVWNLGLAVAVPLVALAGMVGVIWVIVRTEHPEVMVPLVLAATGALIATLRGYQNAASIQEVHDVSNSRLTEALSEIKDLRSEMGVRQGRVEGKEEERERSEQSRHAERD